jgi:hypothetical protein
MYYNKYNNNIESMTSVITAELALKARLRAHIQDRQNLVRRLEGESQPAASRGNTFGRNGFGSSKHDPNGH